MASTLSRPHSRPAHLCAPVPSPCPALAALVLSVVGTLSSGCSPAELRPDNHTVTIRIAGRPHQVELAASYKARSLWLRLRRPPAGKPMLLLYPAPQSLTFVGRDLTRPVEVVFVDGQDRLLPPVALAPASADRAVREAPGDAVLMAKQGLFQALGLSAGMRVHIPQSVRELAAKAWRDDAIEDKRVERDWGWHLATQPSPH
jgi:uncharacterized membrane protein (UPF0127 family)